jgi:hypothetical protein
LRIVGSASGYDANGEIAQWIGEEVVFLRPKFLDAAWLDFFFKHTTPGFGNGSIANNSKIHARLHFPD